MNGKIIAVICLLLLLVIFTAQNYEIVTINFLFWSFRTSRAILLFVTLLIGFISGWILNAIFKE